MTELGNVVRIDVVRIDDERIADHLGKIVRGSIEDTLNALLEAEADRLVGAERYARGEGRRDHRSGHYEGKLQTRGGGSARSKKRSSTCGVEIHLDRAHIRHLEFESRSLQRSRKHDLPPFHDTNKSEENPFPHSQLLAETRPEMNRLRFEFNALTSRFRSFLRSRSAELSRVAHPPAMVRSVPSRSIRYPGPNAKRKFAQFSFGAKRRLDRAIRRYSSLRNSLWKNL